MKRLSYLLTAAALLAFASCGDTPAENIGNPETESWNLFATTDGGPSTRVSIGAPNGEGTARPLTWHDGDKLTVFDGSLMSEFTLENTGTGKFTTESGSLSNDADYRAVIYMGGVTHSGGVSITMPGSITVSDGDSHLSKHMVLVADNSFRFTNNTASGVALSARTSVLELGLQLAAGDTGRALTSLVMKSPVADHFITKATVAADGSVSVKETTGELTLTFDPALDLSATAAADVKLIFWVNPDAAEPTGNFTFTLNDSNDYTVDIEKPVFTIAPGTYYNAPAISPADNWMLDYALKLKWIGDAHLGDIRSVSPAVDASGDVVMTSNTAKLIKFSGADGSKKWEYNLWNTDDFATAPAGHQLSSPAIDTDGTIFVATGTTAPARFYAINSGGTKKWVLTKEGFWGNGSTPNPNIQYSCPAIGSTKVFIGNQGTAGTVLAINKTTGTKVAHMSSGTNGTGGPAGGGTGSVLLTKDDSKVVWAGGKYGLYIGPATDPAEDTDYNQLSVRYTGGGDFANSVTSAMAFDAEGTFYAAIDKTAANGGKSVEAVKIDGTKKWATNIEPAGGMDQGGIAIDKDGILYAAVKMSSAKNDGGIVAINSADGAIKWRFKTSEDVSAVPAIDQDGNIHVATDSGNYYILKNEGTTCSVLLKVDLVKLIMSSGTAYADDWVAGKGKCWSSPAIAPDGSVYVGITNATTQAKSLLIGLRSARITGLQVGAPWPMRGQNPRHTNKQP